MHLKFRCKYIHTDDDKRVLNATSGVDMYHLQLEERVMTFPLGLLIYNVVGVVKNDNLIWILLARHSVISVVRQTVYSPAIF